MAFLENAIDKTVAVLQWVRAADGFVSFDKYVVAGIKEKDAGFDTEIIQVAEHGCQIVKVAAGTESAARERPAPDMPVMSNTSNASAGLG